MIEARSFDIGGESEEAEFSNQVEIRTPEGTITAESATFDQNNVDVAGRVTFTAPDVKVYGEDAQFDREAETMQFSAAGFAEYLALIRETIEQGQRSGVFRKELNAKTVAKVVFGALDEMATNWILSQRKYKLAPMADQVLEILLDGVNAR